MTEYRPLYHVEPVVVDSVGRLVCWLIRNVAYIYYNVNIQSKVKILYLLLFCDKYFFANNYKKINKKLVKFHKSIFNSIGIWHIMLVIENIK